MKRSLPHSAKAKTERHNADIHSCHEKIVGILGGMGPESTADLFFKIIKTTPAQRDQDHLRIIIDNNPKIPDRTSAMLGKGESPLEQMKNTILNLEKAGADLIAIPCNTAHYYFKELQDSTEIPIINMISETAQYIRTMYPKIRKVGLLATTGTIHMNLYNRELKDFDILVPNEHAQQKVMDAIYGTNGVKAGFTTGSPHTNMVKIAKLLGKEGAEVIILGCTEISLAIHQQDISIPLIDPVQILAEAVIKQVLGKIKKI